MTQTASTQAFVGHARVVTSLGQECDIEAQSCPLHLTIVTPRGPVRYTMTFIVLPGGGDVVIMGQTTLREKLGIGVMAQLKASVRKAQGRQDGGGMEPTTRSVGEPIDGSVLRVVVAVAVFVPGGDAPGDVDDEVALTLPSQRPMVFQDSEMKMRDPARACWRRMSITLLIMAPRRKSTKTLRNIVFRTHLDVLYRALSGDPPPRNKLGAIRFHSGARVVRAKPPPERNRLGWSAAESCPDCRSVVTTNLSSRWLGKNRRRRGAPGSRCRTCLMARRPC